MSKSCRDDEGKFPMKSPQLDFASEVVHTVNCIFKYSILSIVAVCRDILKYLLRHKYLSFLSCARFHDSFREYHVKLSVYEISNKFDEYTGPAILHASKFHSKWPLLNKIGCVLKSKK